MNKSPVFVKSVLITKLSEKMNIPENIIDAVVVHELNSVVEAVKKNNSVEISGFGKFVFNERKAKAQINRFVELIEETEHALEDDTLSNKRRINATYKLEKVKKALLQFKTNSEK
jgi:nucleoid DNA-binding protein